MKKMLLFAFVAIMAIGASAQMNVWENGGLSAQYAIESVDSVTFGITSTTPSSGIGKDGITPLLKIENDYWYISYDEGLTWQQEGKAKGEKGDKGDSMLQSVTQDEKYVYLTLLDSSTIKIAKSQNTLVNDSTTHQGYKYVDLGLSVKWATTNVGAELPGDMGTQCTCPNPIAGGEDIATKERGGTWRTPTITEFQELIDNCSVNLHHVINSSGEIVYGLVFTGKNKNSIFLPFKSYKLYPSSYEFLVGSGFYWSSNVNMTDERTIGRTLRIYVQIREWNDDIVRNYENELLNLDIKNLCPIRPICE
jgi:hypothetical protein